MAGAGRGRRVSPDCVFPLPAQVRTQPQAQRWAFQLGALDVAAAALTTRFRNHEGVVAAAKEVQDLIKPVVAALKA